MRFKLGFFTACLVAVGCLQGIMAHGAGPAVHDNAGLFSAGAVKQADETIRNIQREVRKDLLVESFAGVPEGRTADYTRNREQFFADFVRERAQATRVDGIYVLIMKEPPPRRLRIQVGIGQATRQRAFVPSDRDELVQLIQSSFRAEQYDDGLRNAVAFVQRRLRSNLQSSTSSPGAPGVSLERATPVRNSGSNSPMRSLVVVALLIGGGILVVSLLMRLLGGGTRGGASMAGAGGMRGGGGGFFSSLLGGIGGVIAGSWLYDHFLGGNAHAADHSSSNSPETPASDVGGDYSSSGGDVDMGSGGDFGGGGDSGGGGDFGGGGDV